MRTPFTQIYIHLIWSTWDRLPIVTSDIQPRIYALMLKKCKDMKCDPLAIGGINNHVHLLVHLNPAVSISELVKEVKGASSHLVNYQIKPGGDFKWQGAYMAYSIRKNEVEYLSAYIRNQAKHHAENSVLSELEGA